MRKFRVSVPREHTSQRVEDGERTGSVREIDTEEECDNDPLPKDGSAGIRHESSAQICRSGCSTLCKKGVRAVPPLVSEPEKKEVRLNLPSVLQLSPRKSKVCRPVTWVRCEEQYTSPAGIHQQGPEDKRNDEV